MQSKPILCIDFDGVIHDYREGWKDGSIYGEVTPGFFEWAHKAKDAFRLVIYSSRSKTPEGLEAMKEWLVCQLAAAQGYDPSWWSIGLNDFEFAHEKPPAFLTIDDRCVPFRGSWLAPDLHPGAFAAYKTWSQK